jgi:hypothetical protein
VSRERDVQYVQCGVRVACTVAWGECFTIGGFFWCPCHVTDAFTHMQAGGQIDIQYQMISMSWSTYLTSVPHAAVAWHCTVEFLQETKSSRAGCRSIHLSIHPSRFGGEEQAKHLKRAL